MPKSEMQQKQPGQDDQHLCRSLWAEYVKELHNLESLERPYGFITYKIDGEIGHIADLYIKPEYRAGGFRRKLFDEMEAVLRKAGASQAVGQIQVGVNGATRRLAFWLTMGAEVYKADRNVIYFVKRLL